MWSLNTARKEWANWRCAIGQSSTYLGLALIGFIWISLSFHLQVERSAAERAAIQNSRNLVRVFEEHLSRSIHDIDRALKVLRSHYVRNPASIDLEDWKRNAQIVSDPATRVSIVGPDGFVRLSSGNGGNSVDYSGREHFRVHVKAATDELFISPPVVGLISGKLAIFLTRRIENPDGSFGGIIVASLDPSYFARFYSSVDTGLDGYARIIGTDGIVRAEGGVTTNFIGRDMSGGALFKRYMEDPTGWFYTDHAMSDHIHRLIVYRRLKDFPLIVNLGLATKQIFLEVTAKQHAYYVFATIFSALILIIMGFSVRGRLLLERKSAELRTQNLRFDAALQNMSQGLSMFDRDGRLIVCNDRYAQVYGLPRDAEARHDAEADPGAQGGVRDLRGTDAGRLRRQAAGSGLATQADRHHRRAQQRTHHRGIASADRRRQLGGHP